MKVITVVAAALRNEAGLYLLAQRPEGKSMAGMWELPGGKLEANETPEAALARELEEELGIRINATELTPLTFASHSYEDFHLLMPVFLSTMWHGVPEAKEGQTLGWFSVEDMHALPMPEADLPLLNHL